MVDALRIDGDDLSFDLLPAIERSFGVELPHDELRRLVTAGDLHVLICKHAAYQGGDRCGTSHAFYMLRRATAQWGLPVKAEPSRSLADVSLSPRALRLRLQAATGLEMPGHVLGSIGSIGCAATIVGAVAAVWQVGWWTIFPALLIGALCLRFDRGAWKGEWATLGSLARAVTARNHALLAKSGAIHSPATCWLALTEMLAQTAVVDRNDIVEHSRLMV